MERCYINSCSNGGRYNVDGILYCGNHNKEFKNVSCQATKKSDGIICGKRASVKNDGVFTCKKHNSFKNSKISNKDLIRETPLVKDISKITIGDCAICCENDKELNILSCSHGFCKDCHNTWFKKNKTCPMCRKVLDKEEIDLRFKKKSEQAMNILNNAFNVSYDKKTIDTVLNIYKQYTTIGSRCDKIILNLSVHGCKDTHNDYYTAYNWFLCYYKKMYSN